MGQEIIGRRTIRRWLDNWEHIQRREPMEDQVKVNSGCKPADGITNGMLNKIMLEMAYDRLPLELRRVAYQRTVQFIADFDYLRSYKRPVLLPLRSSG